MAYVRTDIAIWMWDISLVLLVAALAVYGQKSTILSQIQIASINEKMGFSKNESACIAVACGELSERNVKIIKKPLIEVSPTDYTLNSVGLTQKTFEVKYRNDIAQLPFSLTKETLYARRSARNFVALTPTTEQITHFFELFSILPPTLHAYIVLLQSPSKPIGLYHQNRLLQAGDLSAGVVHLAVDQKFVANATAIVVLTSKNFAPEQLIEAGMFVHYISIEVASIGWGATGIGAYYEQEMQNFLETQEAILYVAAVGKESK